MPVNAVEFCIQSSHQTRWPNGYHSCFPSGGPGFNPQKGQYAEFASPDQGVKMVPAIVRNACLHPCEGCPCSQSHQGDYSHHGWLRSQFGS